MRDGELACDMCGSLINVIEDVDSARHCADCLDAIEHPEVCFERIEGMLCGNHKSRDADRCHRCTCWLFGYDGESL